MTPVTLYVRSLSAILASDTYVKHNDKSATLSCFLAIEDDATTGVQSVTWKYKVTGGSAVSISSTGNDAIVSTQNGATYESTLTRSSITKSQGGEYSCTFDLGIGSDVVSTTALYVHFLTPLATAMVNPATISCVYEGTDDPSAVQFHAAGATEALTTSGAYEIVPGTFTSNARTDILKIDLTTLSGVTNPTKVECKYTFTTSDTLASSTTYEIRKVSTVSTKTYAVDSSTLTISCVFDYGVGGTAPDSFTWTGLESLTETDEVSFFHV